MNMRKLGKKLLLVLALGVATNVVQAQTYPDKPIKFVAAFPAGGGVDSVARIVGAALSTRIQQPVVVENKAGASGTLGSATVAIAPTDGYTVLVTSNPSITIAAARGDKLAYDPLNAFVPVIKATVSPSIIVSGSDQPYKTLADMINQEKSKPGSLNFASAGLGSTQHLEMEIAKDLLGIRMVHVPYRGTSLFMSDLLSGQIEIGVTALPASSQHVKAGRLNGLAVLSATRSSTLPEVPTMRELTGVDFDGVSSWFGFLVPAGTPQAIVARLEEDIRQVLKDPATRARLEALGMDIVSQGSNDFRKANEAETKLISDVIRRNGITMQ